jgi:hypothetical protein
MPDRADSEIQLQEAVTRADRARRGRDAARRLWRIAPAVAAGTVAIALLGRLRGWTPFVTLLIIGIAALALAAYVLTARRHRTVSNDQVSRIDDDAELHGELRSAHWFTLSTDRDDWVRFHLARAAERVRAVDWARLYPAPAAGRAKLATGVMAAAAIAIALLLPARAGVSASDGKASKAAAARRAGVILALPPDLRKKLEALLTTAEGVDGRALSASEVRDLLAKLDELAKQDPAKQAAATAKPGDRPATEADIKAFAERAKKASESTSLEPEVRDALSDMADKLGDKDDQNANAMSARDSQDAAAKQEGAGEAQQSKSGAGKQDASAQAQSVKEAAGGSAAGVVMMTTDDASNARDGGMGLGGGSADKKGNGQLADLGAALRKETIDASVDNAGENVSTADRRKTEQANASTAYSRAAAQPAERGSSTAPPPVPESRRAAVKSYFIRKQ